MCAVQLAFLRGKELAPDHARYMAGLLTTFLCYWTASWASGFLPFNGVNGKTRAGIICRLCDIDHRRYFGLYERKQ